MKTAVVLAVMVFLVPSPIRCTEESEDGEDFLCEYYDCEEDECLSTEDCQYGTVPDLCHCCLTCAKGPGDVCEGMFSHAGFCAEGLVCISHPKYHQLPGICAYMATTSANAEDVLMASGNMDIPEDDY